VTACYGDVLLYACTLFISEIFLCDVVDTGQYFMSFEYIPYDVGAVVKAGDIRLSSQHIAVIIFQLLKALAYCHQRNIVHCDVKPSNILLAAK